jgi:hypothetical protein
MKKKKKKIGAEQKKKEEEKKTEITTEKNDTDIDPLKLNSSFTTVSKYAFDTSNNKFIKLYLTDEFEGIKSFNSSNIKSKFTKNSFDVCILG